MRTFFGLGSARPPMQLEVLDASEEDYQSCGGADAVRLLQHQGVEP